MKFFATLLLFLVLAPLCLSQTAVELHSAVLSSVEQRRYADALTQLASLEEKHPDIFRLNHYDYLSARIEEQTGNTADASARYLAVVKRGSILKPYALLHLSRIARATGSLTLERTYLDEIAAFSDRSLIADAARNRRARSWFDSGNYSEALRAFENIVPSQGVSGSRIETGVARENRLFLARSQMLAGNTAAARELFASIIGTLANPAQPDDFALGAAKALDKLDLPADSPAGSVPKLTDYEHLRRASIYQFNRDFADARQHYSAIIRDHPASGIVPDAIFQTGRGYAQEGNFSEALRWFERALEQFPDHPIARDALLQAASTYPRVSKFREGIRRYQDYIAKYADDERVNRAYLNIIDIYRDEGEEIEAAKWAVKVQEVFRGKLPEAQALFAEARIDLGLNRWDAALAKLDKLLTMPDLGGAAVPGGTSKAEITFLRGYVFEQKRSFADAINTYLSIPDGRAEYYGWQATERLQELARGEAARNAVTEKLAALSTETKEPETNRQNLQSSLRLTVDPSRRQTMMESLRKIYDTLPAYKKLPEFKLLHITRTEPRKTAAVPSGDLHKVIAEELAFLGLYDEAAPEYEASQKTGTAAAGDLAYTLAVINKRGDRAHRAVTFAEPVWRAVPADYQVELIPHDQIELLYPAPYRGAFLEHAVPRNVDPRFLLSIVRQESRYRPDVKSYAAARGMMQFISTTSEKIAAELGRTNFIQDELYEPSTAVLFGSQYTANLFKMFPKQPEAVAASYNGGEDNMRRWMKRSKSDVAARYVPEIAFSQSKDYVYKVMANYRMYQLYYDENLSKRAGN